MEESTKKLYIELEHRYIKVVWSHKIQECQADIYRICAVWVNRCMAILSVAVSFMSLSYLLNWLDCLGVKIAVSLCSIAMTYLTIRFNNRDYEKLALENKRFATELHNVRNMYESLMTDIVAGMYPDDIICEKRDLLQNSEYNIYPKYAPHVWNLTIRYARRKLFKNGDSNTTDDEMKKLIPRELLVL